MGATREYRKLITDIRDSYVITSKAYGSLLGEIIEASPSVPNISITPRGDLLTSAHFFQVNYNFEKFRRTIKSTLPQILREQTLIRLISAFEVYIVDIISLMFTKDPSLFNNIKSKSEATVEELVALGTMSELKSYFLMKEIQKIQKNKGDLVSKLASLTNIRLNSNQKLWDRIEEYIDRRNILVHYLGENQDRYAKSYNNNSHKLYISHKYIQMALLDFYAISSIVAIQVKEQLSQQKPTNFGLKRARAIARFEIRSGNQPNILQPSFTFQSGAKIVALHDIAKLTRQGNRIVLDIEGRSSYVESLLHLIRNYLRIGEIYNLDSVYVYRYVKKHPIIDSKLVTAAGEIYEGLEDKENAADIASARLKLPKSLVFKAIGLHIYKVDSTTVTNIVQQVEHLDNKSSDNIESQLGIHKYTVKYIQMVKREEKVSDIIRQNV